MGRQSGRVRRDKFTMKDSTAILQARLRLRNRATFDHARRNDVRTGIRNFADLRHQLARAFWSQRRNRQSVAA